MICRGGISITWKLKKKVREALARERGTVCKEHGGRVRVCLVYPNIYSLGMTNLGFQTVYHLLNEIDACVCERAFLPDKTEQEEYSRTSTELFSYESQTPLKDFDIIAFSIPFEDDYLNIPKILKLSGVPALSRDRADFIPLVVAGGVAVSLNPEPIADFVDLFLIGEGEGALLPFIDLVRELKDNGETKHKALKELDFIEWAYVPSLYEFIYDGIRIKEIKAAPKAKEKIGAAKNFDLDKFGVPQNYIHTPDTEFKDTFLMEVERGCGRGCRFCAAGFLYLPPRWRSIDKIKETVKQGIEEAGKVGLIGTAVSEYPEIKETLSYGTQIGGEVTLSSLRLDKLDTEFLDLLKKSGYKTITLAPEAGERVRNVVNKGLTDPEIMESIRLIAAAGFLKIKLYFLVGLPAEEDEDAEAIVDLTKRIKAEMKRGELNLSVNPFIPKPFTPFQWHRFEDAEVIDRRLSIIKSGLSKEKGIELRALSAKDAFIQAYIARADRRAGEVILDASENGWKRAIKKAGRFIDESVYSERCREEILPWDLIDHEIKKGYLWKEYQKGLEGRLTPPCDVGSCFRCGVCRPEKLKRQ